MYSAGVGGGKETLGYNGAEIAQVPQNNQNRNRTEGHIPSLPHYHSGTMTATRSVRSCPGISVTGIGWERGMGVHVLFFLLAAAWNEAVVSGNAAV